MVSTKLDGHACTMEHGPGLRRRRIAPQLTKRELVLDYGYMFCS
jgi:hypothetical protein